MNEHDLIPLIVIVGPTAVGKTGLATHRLAKRLSAEIVSADSRQFYRYMDIGTAKPTLEERARVPHHLVDFADPDETVGLAQFLKLARATIPEIASARQSALPGRRDGAVRAGARPGVASAGDRARSGVAR